MTLCSNPLSLGIYKNSHSLKYSVSWVNANVVITLLELPRFWFFCLDTDNLALGEITIIYLS